MSKKNRCKTGVLLLSMLFSMACFGQTPQNVQWDVPYYGYGQLTYLNWGQSACGPTSITGLLRFWFPNSTISIPEVYHGATQVNTYNGPLYWYRNVGFAFDAAKNTPPDTAYDRVSVPIPEAYQGTDYQGVESKFFWDNASEYLSDTWGGHAHVYLGGSLQSMLAALQNGPVIARVYEYEQDGHYVLVTGYNEDAQGNESVYFNEPYYPYAAHDSPYACYGATIPLSAGCVAQLKDRKLSLAQFSALYQMSYMTYAPPSNYGTATNASEASDVRLNTVIVDNGSYYLDEVLATGAQVVPSHSFQVDDDQAQTSPENYVWQLHHQGGEDYVFPTEGGHWVRWTPSLVRSGWYTVKVRSYMTSNSSGVSYAVKLANGQVLGGLSVNQNASSIAPFEQSLGTYYLAPGAYVEVADMPANTAADTVAFEYVGVNSCQDTGSSSQQSLSRTRSPRPRPYRQHPSSTRPPSSVTRPFRPTGAWRAARPTAPPMPTLGLPRASHSALNTGSSGRAQRSTGHRARSGSPTRRASTQPTA